MTSLATAPPTEKQDLPLILVNGTEIPQHDLAAELQYHPANEFQEALDKAALALIIRELLLQQARAKQLEPPLDLMEGESPEEGLIRSLIATEVIAPQPDEASCLRYFENNRQRFCSSPLLEASHILIAASPEDAQARHESLQQAEQLVDMLKQDPDKFGHLAKKYSACPSNKTDGNLGQISKGQTVPEFERQLFTMEPGLFTTPVESRYGYHIVRVDRKIAGQQLEYEQARSNILLYLGEQGHRRALRQYLRDLIENADITGISLQDAIIPLSL